MCQGGDFTNHNGEYISFDFGECYVVIVQNMQVLQIESVVLSGDPSLVGFRQS